MHQKLTTGRTREAEGQSVFRVPKFGFMQSSCDLFTLSFKLLMEYSILGLVAEGGEPLVLSTASQNIPVAGALS